MAKKRKKPIKRYAVAIIAALILLGASGWVQAADVPVCTRGEVDAINPSVVDGELHVVMLYSCAEGGIEVTVNDRVFARDEAPDDQCAGYWRDAAMLEGGQPTSMSNWGEPDWQFVPSQAQGCPSPASFGGC